MFNLTFFLWALIRSHRGLIQICLMIVFVSHIWSDYLEIKTTKTKTQIPNGACHDTTELCFPTRCIPSYSLSYYVLKKAKQMPYQPTLLWRIRKTVYNLYYFVHKCHWWLWKYVVLPTRVSIAVWIFYTNAFSYLLISITYHRTYQCWPTFAIIPEIQNVTILRET